MDIICDFKKKTGTHDQRHNLVKCGARYNDIRTYMLESVCWGFNQMFKRKEVVFIVSFHNVQAT